MIIKIIKGVNIKMIKGLLLSIFVSIFIISLIFTLSGISGNLHPTLTTGNIIGTSQFTTYSVITLIISFIISFFIVKWIRKVN